METTWFVALGAAVLLGIQTSISPCPLATNVAAISFVGRRAGSARATLLSSCFYALGRAVAYTTFALILSTCATLTGENLTRNLGVAVRPFLGPAAIAIGIVLTGLTTFRGVSVDGEKAKRFAEKFGPFAAFPLGVLFAAAFCPTSAATFLGTVALATKERSPVLLPTVFGLATAAPALIFGAVVALNAQAVGRAFNIATKFDLWSRWTTGTLLIVVGVWLSLRDVWGVF